MTKQELQQIIEDLNQLANNDKKGYVYEREVLEVIRDDSFKAKVLDILASNNIPYTLARISADITYLAHRIYVLSDCDASEEEYLNESLTALEAFKSEILRIEEYVALTRRLDTIQSMINACHKDLLKGAKIYDYKCSLRNIEP